MSTTCFFARAFGNGLAEALQQKKNGGAHELKASIIIVFSVEVIRSFFHDMYALSGMTE